MVATIVGLTIGSIAFWKVFLGCLWFVGIVAMSLAEGGYRSVAFECRDLYEGGSRSFATAVSTALWLPLFAVDIVIVIYGMLCLVLGRFGLMLE